MKTSTYLTKLYEIVDMLGALENEEEVVFLLLFLHSLIGKENERYLNQSTSTMTNWNLLEEKLLNKFFPHNKFMEVKTIIVVYSQGAIEHIYEVWKRYNPMLRRCPNNGFDELAQIHNLRNGLQQQPKLLLDSTVEGSLMSKSAKDATTITERMEINDHQGQNNSIS